MIDYVKILFNNIDVKRLYNVPFLDFKADVNLKTGETTSKMAKHHFCKITIYESGIVMFTGSIHKLYNSLKEIRAPNYREESTYKGFNGNQFTASNIFEVREYLKTVFNCESKQMIFQNIEFGVNTTLGFDPQLFLKGLLFHSGSLFEYKYKEHYSQVNNQRYLLKIYNKSNQYKMSTNTLRVEIKTSKMEFLKQTKIQVKIKTFQDVTTKTLNKAEELLLKAFDKVVYYDYTITEKHLTRIQKQNLKLYSNPRYWIYYLSSKHRDRPKKRLKDILQKYSQNLHSIITEDIKQKCVIINSLSKQPKCVVINSSYIELNTTQNQVRKCPVTGIDLSREKECANYILTSTLRYLKRHDKNKYFEVCGLLLKKSNPYHTKYEEDIINHLAKQIRNRFNNRRTIRDIGYKTKLYYNQYALTF